MNRGADPIFISGREAARRLSVFARTWANRLSLVTPSLASNLPRVERELTAFGLYLLQLQLERRLTSDGQRWFETVRQECTATSGPVDHGSRPPGESQFGLQLEAWSPTEGPTRAREAYAQFCLSTGLGDSPLVGRGENLAALIFYITLHALVSRDALATRDQVRVLLRAAQEVRTHLKELVTELSLNAEDVGKALASQSLQASAPRAYLAKQGDD